MRLKNSFGNCSKCGKQIMWIKTKAGKSYYSMMLQDKTGTVDAKVWELTPVGTVQDYPEHATGFGYISHFATCEAAQMFRKKKKAAV